MRARTLALLWLAVSVAVWCGFFDLYIARGADRYLKRRAEYELHLVADEPSMPETMARAQRQGAIRATLWAALVGGLGALTIWTRGGRRLRTRERGSL